MGEQKILEVADYVLGFTTHRHPVSLPAGQCILGTPAFFQVLAVLIHGGDLKIVRHPHPSLIRNETTGQYVEECGFAGPIGTNDTKPVAAQHSCRETSDDFSVAIAFRYSDGFDGQLAGKIRITGIHLRGSVSGPLGVAALLTQVVQGGEAALVSFAPGGDAVTQPVFFFGDFLYELLLGPTFLFKNLIAPGFKMFKAPIDMPCNAAV